MSTNFAEPTELESDDWIESVIAFQASATGYLIAEGLKHSLSKRFESEQIKSHTHVAGGPHLCIGILSCGCAWRVAAAIVQNELEICKLSSAEIFWLDLAEQLFRPMNSKTSKQMTFKDFRAILEKETAETRRLENQSRELARINDMVLETIRAIRRQLEN